MRLDLFRLARLSSAFRALVTAPHRLRGAWSIFWPAAILVAVLRLTGVLEPYALTLYDTFNYFSAKHQESPRVVVLSQQLQDLKDPELYPLSDEKLNELLLKVLAQSPRLIVIDTLLNKPRPPGNDALNATLLSNPNIQIRLFGDENGIDRHSGPKIAIADARIAMSLNTFDDADFVTRRVLLGFYQRGVLIRETALNASNLYLHLGGHLNLGGLNSPNVTPADVAQAAAVILAPDNTLARGTQHYTSVSPSFGEYTRADSLPTFLVPAPHWQLPTNISFGQLQRGAVAPDIFRDKVVVLGLTASAVGGPGSPSPLGRRPGQARQPIYSATITAINIDKMLAVALDDWPVMRSPHAAINWLWITFWTALAGFCLAPMSRFGTWTGASFLIIGSLFGISYLAYFFGWWLPLVSPLLGILLCLAVAVRLALRSERSLKDMIKVMGSVLDQLPEPVFVKDPQGRLRLVNEAFCRLAGALPEELTNATLASTVPGLILPQSDINTMKSGECTRSKLTNRYGEQFELMLISSRVPSASGEDLLVALIRDVQAIHSTPRTPVLPAAQIQKRFEQARFWAQSKSNKLTVSVLELLDVEIIHSAYDAAILAGVRQLAFERLCRAWPQAEVLSELNEYQYLLILSFPQTSVAASAVAHALQTSFASAISFADALVEVEFDAATVELATSDTLLEPLVLNAQQRLRARAAHQL